LKDLDLLLSPVLNEEKAEALSKMMQMTIKKISRRAWAWGWIWIHEYPQTAYMPGREHAAGDRGQIVECQRALDGCGLLPPGCRCLLKLFQINIASIIQRLT
jgi:hypothetical protein